MPILKDAKVGEIVRNKASRECYLVVGKNTQGLLVVNLMLDHSPAIVMMILPSKEDGWDKDTDINDLESWEVDGLTSKMSLIEDMVENT